MAEDANELAIIQRNPTEQLKITISTYKGNQYLNMRIYYTTDDGNNWLPTKKGVTFGKDSLVTLEEAVQKAKEIMLGEEEV